MVTKDEIKKTILKVAGDPVTGVVKDLADAWATAIHELYNPNESKVAVPSTNKRVVEPQETR